MSDPLSVAASIAGLIAVAGQLYSLVDKFISGVQDAPSLARTVHAELNGCRNCLLGLQKLLTGPALRPSRAALIPADHVVVSFTDAVLLFSELEATVLPLVSYGGVAAFSARARWARKESRLTTLITRLQWQKITLTMQLNILQCNSDVEAERDRAALHAAVMQKLARDGELERRLELVEQRLLRDADPSVFDNRSLASTASSDNLTIVPISTRQTDCSDSTSLDSGFCIPHHEFEESLKLSWVYRRVQHREEDMSFRSSLCRQSAWSMLSDLSLANLSVLSVIALPISIDEIYNSQWYESAAHPEPPADSDTQNSFRARSDALKGPSMRMPFMANDVDPVDISAGALFTGTAAIDTELLSYASPAEKGNAPMSKPGASGTEPHSESSDSVNDQDMSADRRAIDEASDDECYPCRRCGLILEEGKAFELAGNRWHADCFRCQTCSILLDSDANLLLLGDGSLICDNCGYNCSTCGHKIEDLAVLTGDQAFCRSCFKCRNCKREIESLRYARTTQGIFCMSCHEALMARRRKKAKAKAKDKELAATAARDGAVREDAAQSAANLLPPHVADKSTENNHQGAHHSNFF